jgi:hypothetical protein
MPKKAAATAPAAAAAAAVAAPVAAPSQPTEMETVAPQVKKIVFEQPVVLSTVVDKNDDMEYDLGNLCSFDANPLPAKLASCVSVPNFPLVLLHYLVVVFSCKLRRSSCFLSGIALPAATCNT